MTAATQTDPVAELESDHRLWRTTLFPNYVSDANGAIVPDAPHQRAFWDWLWTIERGQRKEPWVGIWARGAAKSTNAELGVVALAARHRRKYAWYVSATQVGQADPHVATIGAMLEEPTLAAFYPELATRRLGKYGHARGWRGNRLSTASGFTCDAIGLDKAIRGRREREDRPDLIIIDDVDDALDTPIVTKRKIQAITRRLIPAGSEDVIVIAIQNIVHDDSFFARIVDGRADYLQGATISGPHPAFDDLEVENIDGRWTITQGTPTWEGFDLAAGQAMIDKIGYSAFLSEYQHATEPPAGELFGHLEWGDYRIDPDDIPELRRVVVAVDPAITHTDKSDAQGIQIDGLGVDGKVYRLYSWERRSTPLKAISRAILKGAEYGADTVVVETDQGGDTWESVYREATAGLVAEGKVSRRNIPRFAQAKAGAGRGPKTHRAAQMLTFYERDQVRHVRGTHRTLERALTRFDTPPLDLVDAAFWSIDELKGGSTIAGSKEPDEAPPGEDPYAAPRRSVLRQGPSARPR